MAFIPTKLAVVNRGFSATLSIRSRNKIQIEFDSYEDFIGAFLDSITMIDQDTSLREYIELCCDIIEAESIPKRTKSSLIHLDYHTSNIIVGESYDDVYLIDFENGCFGPHEMDIVKSYITFKRKLGERFCEIFLRGYGIQLDEISRIEICLGILKEVSAMRWWEKI